MPPTPLPSHAPQKSFRPASRPVVMKCPHSNPHSATSIQFESNKTVRIWTLSAVVPLFLLATLVPVHDVVVRIGPQCFPSVEGHEEGTGVVINRNSTTIGTYNLEDRDYLVRTVAFEATNEPALGKAAVAHVVLNRKKSGRWGGDIKHIVTQPWQFEPWMTRRKEIEKLSPDDSRYRTAARIVDGVLNGYVPDPTASATYFLNATIVRQRRGGLLPPWAQGEGLVIRPTLSTDTHHLPLR